MTFAQLLVAFIGELRYILHAHAGWIVIVTECVTGRS
jgi:hypothetical protein